MKKIFFYTLTALTLTGTFGCKKFLDQVPDDRLTFEQAFAQRETLEQLLANVYSTLPDEMVQRSPASSNAGPWTGASDEVNYTLNNWAQNLNTGNWDPTSGIVNDMWNNYYKGIQAASNFMANVNRCQDCNLSGVDFINRYYNEARGIRAIYYFYLLRQFGPVVLLGQNPSQPDAPVADISRARSPFDTCVDFVVSELDAASAGLPNLPVANEDYGHVNKAVLQAYKVKLLLTAASPLFNGNADYANLKNADGTQLISQTYNVQKWRRAADAAKAFLTAFPNYTLYKKNAATPFQSAFESVRDVMLTDWNSEVIFARINANVTFFQYDVTPNHTGAGGGDKGGSFRSATQQMVEAYFMANGKPTDDPTSGYTRTGFTDYAAPEDNGTPRSISNMFANREPRFYAGITYTGRRWINPNTSIITDFTFNGNAGRANIGNDDYTSTGYTQRKNLSTAGWTTGGRADVVVRLAEIYLAYAEALNEVEPGNPEVLTYLNAIRTRAGIPAYGNGAAQLPVPADMRDAIRRERRVELAFENSRYFDTRRWKIAEQTDKLVSGLSIQQNSPGFYNVVVLENRTFDKKHYLWPIPNAEIQRVPLLVQNTGW
ncbi:RagB/SusD family nutrient uptake outer membrane protein [Pedobacter sp. SYP-B3415]|uniref:RagB/SusD family nutrient uptake outer membrane protein n=1 Tax=Pedobacter sp. SYP-B3415 TaxID=2496641 RepID=UPI00101CCBAB|nr:RagB/SusD family nutrient uptake outer membrane protein [Pedobacter sp. SYP-B3415]